MLMQGQLLDGHLWLQEARRSLFERVQELLIGEARMHQQRRLTWFFGTVFFLSFLVFAPWCLRVNKWSR